MNNINKLIPHVPLILHAKEMKFTFAKISQILNTNFNVETNEIFIRKFYYKIRDKTLKNDYKNIKCFMKNDIILIEHNIFKSEYIMFMDSFYIAYSSVNIPEELLLVDLNSIKSIHDPVARIYAKWFSRNFYIDNSTLLNEFEVSCSEEQMNEIKLIPDSIDVTYDKITLELLTKRFKVTI